MADQFAVASDTSPVSPGTFDLTSASITETVKAALFFYSHSINDATTEDHGCLGVGAWADDGDAGSENSGCMFTRGLAGVETTADVRSYQSADFMASIELDATPLVDLVVDSVTAISGGVRLNAATTTSRTKATAVLFAGLSRAYVSRIAPGTTSAHENAGSVSQFRPDVLIAFGSEGGFAGTKDDFTAALGFVVDGGAHAGAFVNIDRGTDPAEPTSRIDGTTLPYIVQGTGALQSVTFTIDATGYSHQVTAGTGSPDLTVLALKFSSSIQKVADNLPVSTDASQAFSVGFQPQIVLGMATLLASENTTTTDATAGTAGLFAFTSTEARAYTGGHDCTSTIAALTPSVSKSRQDGKAVLTLTHDGTVAQEATLSAFTGTGFTLGFSTATAGHLTLLALGPSAATLIASESETLTESVLVLLNRSLVVSDSIEIIESTPILGTFDVTTSDGPQGVTLGAHAERGTSLQGGPEAGTVL